MDKLALLLVIIGALNWGLIGLLRFDLVETYSAGRILIKQDYLFPCWSRRSLFHYFPHGQ